MDHLPADFAESLAQVLEPSHRGEAAAVIQAASALDDAELRQFLELFAQRVRESPAPLTHAELQDFLSASTKSRRSPGA